jgi:hypothetical protein
VQSPGFRRNFQRDFENRFVLNEQVKQVKKRLRENRFFIPRKTTTFGSGSKYKAKGWREKKK